MHVAPLRGRGLKRPYHFDREWEEVAPLRGRGLKRTRVKKLSVGSYVAPLRGRGLKRGPVMFYRDGAGRSLTGAWIETLDPKWNFIARRSRSLTGAWIETDW